MVVAVCAVVLALACGVAAVLAFTRSESLRDDLASTRGDLSSALERLDKVEADISTQRATRVTLENAVSDLSSSVGDLPTLSSTVSGIDLFLRGQTFATTESVADVAQEFQDLVNCVNDNLTEIAARRTLSYCG